VPADFHEVLIHRLDVDLWHNDRRTCAALRTDCSEQIGPLIPAVARRPRTRAALCPDAGDGQTRVMVPC
jgi:hypothetical protein